MFLRWNDYGNVLSLFERCRGEMMRQMKLANSDFNIDSEVILPAKNFNDPALRILCRRRPVGDFDVDDYPFKIVPICLLRSFIAQHAVNGLFS